MALAKAALRIRAFSRSLQYLETAVVEERIDLSNPSHVDPHLLDKMQLVYRQLDEPDGMVGLETLRRSIGDEPTTRQRIRVFEHAEQ